MAFQVRMITNIGQRAQANKERLQNEIALVGISLPRIGADTPASKQVLTKHQQVYNTVAQRDSTLMVEIGKAAKRDSDAMKAIAIVTMAFLPATFSSVTTSSSKAHLRC